LSVAAYCRREGLQYNSFRRWRLAFRESGEDLAPEECGGAGNEAPGSGAGAIRGSGKDESPEALFAEVTVAPMMPVVEVAALEVVLAGARRIRVAPGFDVDTLRRVVTALEDPRC
jgi:hypothetical protein